MLSATECMWRRSPLKARAASVTGAAFALSRSRRAIYDSYYRPFIGALFAVMALRLLAGRVKRAYQIN